MSVLIVGVGGTGQQTLISNVASTTVMGVEVGFSAYLTERLALRGNLG